MRTNTVIGILISLLISRASAAQNDPMTAIRKIYTAYNKSYTISFSGNMKMYAKNNPGKIIERMSTKYLLKGRNFHCSIGPVDMLLNENYYVSADKSVKVIVIGHKKDLAGTMQTPVLNLDQLNKWIKEKSIEAKVMTGADVQVLQLTDPQHITGYDHYSITYEAGTGFMQKVLLELSDANDPDHKTMMLEINYTPPVNVAANIDDFSEKRFFSIMQNKVQLKNEYKSFQLINQL